MTHHEETTAATFEPQETLTFIDAIELKEALLSAMTAMVDNDCDVKQITLISKLFAMSLIQHDRAFAEHEKQSLKPKGDPYDECISRLATDNKYKGADGIAKYRNEAVKISLHFNKKTSVINEDVRKFQRNGFQPNKRNFKP